jgi:hypothetical protein
VTYTCIPLLRWFDVARVATELARRTGECH